MSKSLNTYVSVFLAKIEPELWDVAPDLGMFPLRIPTDEEYKEIARRCDEFQNETSLKPRRHLVYLASCYMRDVSTESVFIRSEDWATFQTWDDARAYIHQDTSLDDGGWYNLAVLTEKRYGINCLSGVGGRKTPNQEFWRINATPTGCSVELVDEPKRLKRTSV